MPGERPGALTADLDLFPAKTRPLTRERLSFQTATEGRQMETQTQTGVPWGPGTSMTLLSDWLAHHMLRPGGQSLRVGRPGDGETRPPRGRTPGKQGEMTVWRNPVWQEDQGLRTPRSRLLWPSGTEWLGTCTQRPVDEEHTGFPGARAAGRCGGWGAGSRLIGFLSWGVHISAKPWHLPVGKGRGGQKAGDALLPAGIMRQSPHALGPGSLH